MYNKIIRKKDVLEWVEPKTSVILKNIILCKHKKFRYKLILTYIKIYIIFLLIILLSFSIFSLFSSLKIESILKTSIITSNILIFALIIESELWGYSKKIRIIMDNYSIKIFIDGKNKIEYVNSQIFYTAIFKKKFINIEKIYLLIITRDDKYDLIRIPKELSINLIKKHLKKF